MIGTNHKPLTSPELRAMGIYAKFTVTRTDGSHVRGGKHDNCDYFVLDLTHDPFAIPAIKAYADACRGEYPVLAKDLDAKAVPGVSETGE